MTKYTTLGGIFKSCEFHETIKNKAQTHEN